MAKWIAAFIVVGVVLGGLLIYSQRRSAPLVVSGFVEADEIRVGSRVGGRVANVHVAEGAPVTKGQMLVELEPFDLLERRAGAVAELAAAEAEYDRRAAGFRAEEVAGAKARVDQLDAQLRKLRNGPRDEEIAAAQAQLRRASADLELAQTNMRRTETLVERDVATEEDLDQATKELKAAGANVDVRTEELALLLEGTREEDFQQAEAQREEAHQA